MSAAPPVPIADTLKNSIGQEEKDRHDSEGDLTADDGASKPEDGLPVKAAGPDFPDGGLRAWLVVVGSWLASAVSFGYISSFGVYQAYYEANQLSDQTASEIAWIGSLQYYGIFAFGIFVGYLFDAGYARQLVAFGSACMLVAMFVTAECTKLWQFILCQGILGGLGAGFIFLPSASIISHWFRRRRSAAFGIIATGSSAGGVLFPIMLNRLFVEVGFKWAVRIAAFVSLFCMIFMNLLMRPRLPPSKRGSFIDLSHFKDPAFSLFVLAACLIFLGIYTPLNFISTYAISRGVDENLAFYMVAILNAFSTLGRLIPNLFADKIGTQNVLYTASALSGILIYCWLATSTKGGIIAFMAFYGPSSGSFVSTVPAVIANLTTDLSQIGMRSSLCFFFISFAALAGTPITGALQSNGSYVGPACFAGSVVLAGVAVGLVSRQITVRRRKTWRV